MNDRWKLRKQVVEWWHITTGKFDGEANLTASTE